MKAIDRVLAFLSVSRSRRLRKWMKFGGCGLGSEGPLLLCYITAYMENADVGEELFYGSINGARAA